MNHLVFQPIIEMIQADWRNNIKTAWKHEIMVKQARRARIFTISGCIITIISGSGFMIAPILGLSTRTISNITDPYEGFNLHFQSCYPFNYGRSPIFELVYTTQLVTAIFASFPVSAPDNFFGAMVFHASGQCEILQKRAKSLLESEDFTNLTSKNFRKKLGKLVDCHVRLIR